MAGSRPKPGNMLPLLGDGIANSVPAIAPASLGYLAAVILTVIATVVAIGVDSGVSIPNLSLIFVVPVVIVAVTFGLGPSVCSAVLGALAYNFFLTGTRVSISGPWQRRGRVLWLACPSTLTDVPLRQMIWLISWGGSCHWRSSGSAPELVEENEFQAP